MVFRPYTQLRRSICTSESLRASTGVSPGFALVKHSSLSFGSQRVRSRCSRGASASRVQAPANVRPLEEPRACASLPWKPPAATAGRQCVRGANHPCGQRHCSTICQAAAVAYDRRYRRSSTEDRPQFALTAPIGLSEARRLAHVLDSLVRVSRRDGQSTDTVHRDPREGD